MNTDSTYFEFIKVVFPTGTRGLRSAKKPGKARNRKKKQEQKTPVSPWSEFPLWPPDLFAAAALILDKLDGYTYLIDEGVSTKSTIDERVGVVKSAKRIGAKWRNIDDFDSFEEWLKVEDSQLQKLWERFITLCKRPISDYFGKAKLKQKNELSKIAIELLIIADEASEGLGYFHIKTWLHFIYLAMSTADKDNDEILNCLRKQESNRWLIDSLHELTVHLESFSDKNFNQERIHRFTCCILASADYVCVQPKTKTTSVGCTINSVSKNIALLPPRTKVTVNWNTHRSELDKEFLNILAIPYPFSVNGKAFLPTYQSTDGFTYLDKSNFGLFDVNQEWLYSCGDEFKQNSTVTEDPHPNTTEIIVEFVMELFDKALQHVETIDLIVFPELALDEWVYRKLHDAIFKRIQQHDYKSSFCTLIAGVSAPSPSNNSRHTNVAKTSIISAIKQSTNSQNEESEPSSHTINQYKHHRWKIDNNQIYQYGFGGALTPSKTWWENIPIEQRALNFFNFRPGASFITLICEDLARIDPCHHVVRAIGPSIVFALLMDGAQIKGRWPERYAMGLSDDPGCSVFTLTSLGLVTRSNYKFDNSRDYIGLWRDQKSGTHELYLPKGEHALLMNLNLHTENKYTLDGRSTNPVDTSEEADKFTESDQIWALSGVVSIGVGNSKKYKDLLQ